MAERLREDINAVAGGPQAAARDLSHLSVEERRALRAKGRRRNWRAAFMLGGAVVAMGAVLTLWSLL